MSLSSYFYVLAPPAFALLWVYALAKSCQDGELDVKTLLGLPVGLGLLFAIIFCKNFFKLPLILPNLFLSFIFLAALAASSISDLVEMTVPRICSIWLAPFWFCFAKFDLLQVSFLGSLAGGAVGLLVPWGAAALYQKFTGKNGLGFGDVELLAMQGAFLGPDAVVSALYVSSALCLIMALILYLVGTKTLEEKIPFAPFLSLGGLFCFLVN